MFNTLAVRVLPFSFRKIPRAVNFVPKRTCLIQDRFYHHMKSWNFASIVVGALSLAMGCFTGSAATYYVGSIASLTSRIGSQVARRLWLHHNYLHDFVSPRGNGAEAIRLGLSGPSLSTGNRPQSAPALLPAPTAVKPKPFNLLDAFQPFSTLCCTL
jgi:hypothetical protein